MFGLLATSRWICSRRSLLILFLFTALLEYAPDRLCLGGDIRNVEEHSDDFFARNRRFGRRNAHHQIAALRVELRKMTGNDLAGLA